MAGLADLKSDRAREWSAALWDRLIDTVEARLAPLELQLDVQRAVAEAIVGRGLGVIEQELAPLVAQGEGVLGDIVAVRTDAQQAYAIIQEMVEAGIPMHKVVDLEGALNAKAPLASPTFTGTPTAPTAAVGTNTTQVASTAFVLANASSTTPAMDGVAAVGASTRFARGDHVHPTDTSRAPLASPAFSGAPTAPTAPAGTNTTQVATTAFVGAATDPLAPKAGPSFTGTVTIGGQLVLPGSVGTNRFVVGSGDGATYSTHNILLQGWWGLGLSDLDGIVRGVYDFRTGSWDVKGGYKVDGHTVWHSGNDGSGSGLDAGLLGGADAAWFANIPARLGYTPAQQGTGIGQDLNLVKLGWSNALGALKVTVDTTDLGRVWTDSIRAASRLATGYERLPSGLIFQWGEVAAGSATDRAISFPLTFPGYCAGVNIQPLGAFPGGGTITATQSISFASDVIGTSTFALRPRYTDNGGGVGVATQGCRWFAIGW